MRETKKVRFLGAGLACLMLLLAVFVPFGTSKEAHAEDGEYLKDLYYFTDTGYDDIWDIVDTFEEQSQNELNVHYYDWSKELDGFPDRFWFYIDEWVAIHDSYIIFDVYNVFPNWEEAATEKVYSPGDPLESHFLTQLEEMFQLWKEQGCKIMVIFGMDEMRLGESASFLQYADVQINTDTFYPFFYSMVEILYQDNINNMFNKKNLLSPSLSPSIGFGNADNISLFIYLVLYFRENDFNQYGMTYGWTFEDVLVEMSKHHSFWSWEEYAELPYDELPDELVAIGSTLGDYEEYKAWETYIRDLCILGGKEFPIFIYNPYGVTVADWVTHGTPNENIYYSGNTYAVLQQYKPRIMLDFLLGKDLGAYDNWPGTAAVNFKPILPGPNGWIKYPGSIFDMGQDFPFVLDL